MVLPPPAPPAVWGDVDLPRGEVAPPATLGRVTQFGLGVAVMWAGVGVGLNVVLARTLAADVANPSTGTFDDVLGVDVVLGVHELLDLLILVAVGILFITWFHTSHRSVPSFAGGLARHGRAWAIGSWFVPFLNLVRPKQMMDDLWRMSGASSSADAMQIRYKTGPRLVLAWWSAFVTAEVLDRVAGFMSGPLETADSASRQSDAVVMGLSQLATVLAGCLAIAVVRAITMRQERVAAGAPADQGGEVVLVPRWVIAIGAGTLLLAGVTSLPVSAVARAGTGVAEGLENAVQAVEVPAPPPLDVGVCWQDPDATTNREDTSNVETVSCDSPHDREVFAVVTNPRPRGQDYPGRDALVIDASALCADAFEERLGRPYADVTEVNILVDNPAEARWVTGDRRVTCSVYRADREPFRTRYVK